MLIFLPPSHPRFLPLLLSLFPSLPPSLPPSFPCYFHHSRHFIFYMKKDFLWVCPVDLMWRQLYRYSQCFLEKNTLPLRLTPHSSVSNCLFRSLSVSVASVNVDGSKDRESHFMKHGGIAASKLVKATP